MHIIARLFDRVLCRAWLGAIAMPVMMYAIRMITHTAGIAAWLNPLNTHTSVDVPEVPMLGHCCPARKSAAFVWALMFVPEHLHSL